MYVCMYVLYLCMKVCTYVSMCVIWRTTGYVEEEELCTRLQSAMNSFNSLVATNRAEAERRFNSIYFFCSVCMDVLVIGLAA